ncbi:MAG: ABC transporter ATP-binding protein [candidate division Zixibacteria bacterium]|nr:ABC transporter ATP-binding protein [candidate division Zixibacteria bacterium]
MLEILNLLKQYGSLVAVDYLNLKIEKGEMAGLVGPDGAGKTTLMRILSAILPPTSGSARVAGYDIIRDAEKLKEKIGYMPQRFGLYEDLTVLENLNFFSELYQLSKKQKDEKYKEVFNFSQLEPFKDFLAGNLSGGMKQKLALSCVLLHTPEVLLLDEPTRGVDPLSRRDFWRILFEQQKRGITIFISTSYMDEAERCQKVAFLDKGRLIAYGTPKKLKEIMNEFLYEISCDKTREAKSVLEKVDGISGISIFGEKIHFTLREEKLLANIKNKLKDTGVEILNLRRIEPSLEDIFIFLKQDKIEIRNG